MPLNESVLRYRAFLSYNHHDEAVVRVLHRKLETFRVPRALRDAHRHALPARLAPVFRDRDELASSSQLSHSIETALDESQALVVVCSPASAGSLYVNDEIAWFRRHHPERPVLAFVVAGDPGADPRVQVDPDATPQERQPAFPLMLALADVDAPDGALGEPLAADARPQGDGFDSALLKLVAGLLGVRYDELRRREHKRRQRLFVLVSVVSLLLATVFAVLAWQATRARDIARAAQAQAELELTSERQTREFLISVFELADANEARGGSVTVREVLDRAVQRIDRSEFARPAIRARFLATMGQAYASLGLNRRSVDMLRQSIAAASGENVDTETLRQRIDSGVLLAAVLRDMGDYDEALQALDAAEHAGADALQTVALSNVRGEVLTQQERDDDARAAFEAAQRILQSMPESRFRAQELGKTRIGLAKLAFYSGDTVAALTQLDAASRELEQMLGPDHPLVIDALGAQGAAAYRNHQTEAARMAWERALKSAQRVFDPDNPQIGTLNNNLGLLLFEEGDFDAAEPMLRATLESDRRHRIEDYEDLAFPLYNLGFLLRMRGDTDAAHELWREGVDVAQAHGHRMLGPLLAALGDWECELDSPEAGLLLAQRAVDVLGQAGDADAWRVSQARLSLAFCRARNGEHITRQQMAADMDELRQRWPNPANPFRQRAQSQFQTLPRP